MSQNAARPITINVMSPCAPIPLVSAKNCFNDPKPMISKQLARPIAFLATCLLLVISVGCGPSAATMSGMVKYGGQPVKDGNIILQAIDRSGGVAKGKIIDGKYNLDETAELTAGAYRVQIHGYKKSTVKIHDPGEDISTSEDVDVKSGGPASSGDLTLVPFIPTVYNQSTELTADVVAGANEGKDFDLKVVAEKFILP